ncbi:MAG: terminase small subunit [Sulfuricurvum sp.]|jgi:phage terminase small subunit|nr:terminase small subunit [Sulfuricurvum sp.]
MKITRLSENNPKPVKSNRGRKPGAFNRKYLKVKLFVNEYLTCFQTYKAFKKCGYGTGNEETDREQATALYRRPDVQQAIQEEVDRRCKVSEITEQNVLNELAKIAFSDIKNYMAWDSEGNKVFKSSDLLASQHSGAIESLETKEETRWQAFEHVDEKGKLKIKRVAITVPSYKFKLYDKKTALIEVGKHLGLFWESSGQSKDPAEEAKKYQQAMRQIEEATDPTGKS